MVGEAFQQGGCVRSVENGPRKGPQRPIRLDSKKLI